MASGLNWFSGLFLDSTPSIVAAVAIFTTIALFIVTILVSGGSASIGQKVGSAVLLLLVLLPSIGLSLFDITCLMRGGDESLCGILGWVKALLILLYTGLIAVMTIIILLYGKQLQYDGFKGSRSKFTDLAKAQFSETADQPSYYSGVMSEINEGFVGSNVAHHRKLPNNTKPTSPSQAPIIPPAATSTASSIAQFTDAHTGLGAYLTDVVDEEDDISKNPASKKTSGPLTAEAFFGGSVAPKPIVPVSSMSHLTAAMTPFAK